MNPALLISSRRAAVSGLVSVALVVALGGCVAAPHLEPASPPSALATDAADENGLVVNSGGAPHYVELTDGFFVDDADALAVSVKTFQAYLDEAASMAVSGDFGGGGLGDVLTPEMEEVVRDQFAASTAPRPSRSEGEVIDARILRRLENSGGARVHLVLCFETRVRTAGTTRTTQDEVALSLVSSPEKPRHLRIESALSWMGEPIC